MGLTAFIANYITQFMAATGYVTVFFGMVLESMIVGLLLLKLLLTLHNYLLC